MDRADGIVHFESCANYALCEEIVHGIEDYSISPISLICLVDGG